jgi:hypothetical protein
MGDPDGVLMLDESGFVKKGRTSLSTYSLSDTNFPETTKSGGI